MDSPAPVGRGIDIRYMYEYSSGARANGKVAKGTWKFRAMKYAHAAHCKMRSVISNSSSLGTQIAQSNPLKGEN